MRKLIGLTAVLAGYYFLKRKSLSPSQAQVAPGLRMRPDTWLLGKGAAFFQASAPLQVMNLYLNGFHFYADDMGRQMEAHHYCTHLNEEVQQCTIFDGNSRDARLIGIEYIISERLFESLPEEEKKMWHSHDYEVKSGTLIAPGIPLAAEHELMKKIVRTYGKTWHTWDSAHEELPLGIPALMMGFTADGQLQSELVSERDRRLSVDTGKRKENRSDIDLPQVLEGANSWQTGRVVQLDTRVQPFRGHGDSNQPLSQTIQ